MNATSSPDNNAKSESENGTKKPKKKPSDETIKYEGNVLDVVRALLKEPDHTEMVLTIVTKLLAENVALVAKLAQVSGKKNRGEAVSVAQLQLWLAQLKAVEGLETEADKKLHEICQQTPDPVSPVAKPPKQPALRKPAPPELERVANIILVPAAERPCPTCNNERKCVSHEQTEVIELIPAKLIVRVDTREVLACAKCDGEMARAPTADKVIDGGKFGPDLQAWMLKAKYVDGMPLYRMRRTFANMGFEMASSTMSDQIGWLADLLSRLVDRVREKIVTCEVLHCDSTGMPFRDCESKHQVVNGTLCGYVGVNGVKGTPDDRKTLALYEFTSTGKRTGQRPGEIGPIDFLCQRKGPLVVDGANLYDSLFENHPELVECGCNMHARRKFIATARGGDLRATPAIEAFQKIYRIEKAIAHMDASARLTERQRLTRPIYDALIKWCDSHSSEPPKSNLAKAIRYLINQREALTRFIDDGSLPIDNGLVERLHRDLAIGRRNFLFAGSYAGGKRAAIIYTIMGCCKFAGVDPLKYLADILPRLKRERFTSEELDQLLPAEWKKRQAKLAA